MDKQNYYLGLDMGTSSVGWAVTDPQYRLLRKSGKDMWGIREFEEAQAAVERRTNRISRRRRQRELARIGLLKEYFADAIDAVDPGFYQRLENSRYWPEDKDQDLKTKYSLFADRDYTDADYYREYPTIFHLRMELIKNPAPHDVRLVFLALLNMFKHRGHFLFSGQLSSEGDGDIRELCVRSLELAEDILQIPLKDISGRQIEDILSRSDISRSAKAEQLMLLFGITKKQKQETLWVRGICGLKIDAGKLFEDLETEEKTEFCFADAGYEDKAAELEELLGEEYFQIVTSMKAIYDRGILARLLKNASYLSEARIRDYEKHKEDLAKLKRVFRKYSSQEDYDRMFRESADGNYSAYVNSTLSGDKKNRRNMSARKRDDFYASVKKYLKNIKDPDEDVSSILADIETESFMPKQLTSANGVIPNQLHQKEMAKILENAEGYLPFLKEKDESGLSVKERILRLFSFQIPYYIGPVTENSQRNGGTGWVVRKEAGRVLPWNISSLIDIPATSEQFIRRMVRDCTYMSGEKVLPKASLLYESYCVLNEINNIRISGEKISVGLKQDIYNELFKSGKKVTRKQLVKYLKNQGLLKEDAELSGIDATVNNHLNSYGKFYSIFGDSINTDSGKKMVEDLIYWGTIFGQDRKLWKQKTSEKYPDIEEKTLKRILGFKFNDWGKLSRAFLEMPGCDTNTGEIVSLIRCLWETNYNLMELLHSEEYTFGEELQKQHKAHFESLSEITPESMEDYYFSAPVRKMMWQTLGIIREVEKTLGGAPSRVFIEMTRTEDEKGDRGRKDSRKKTLLEKYKGIKDAARDWNALIEKEDASGRLRSKKMFLYIAQMGRDMYSGQPIELDDLFNDNLYDIDHVYPRHFVKDDSIHNNLVLVRKQANAHKSDTYPLESSIRNNPEVQGLWHFLREKGLITEEKYRRLTGRNPFTEEQQADFIARQLVETGQATKGVADFLKEVLPETVVVYSKASNVSEFRRNYDLLKARSVNDFHHAHDAYLNIVVGNAYYVKFTQNPLNYIRKEYQRGDRNREYNLSRMFDWTIRRNDEVAWTASKKDAPGTIAVVKEMLRKNTPLLTRQSFTGHGAISNATIIGKDQTKEKTYLPIKSSDIRLSDVKKYGGYKNASMAYMTLVEHTVKGKRIRSLETIPVYLKERIEKNYAELEHYLTEYLELKDISVRLRMVKIQALIKVNGYYMYIAGKTDQRIDLRNAVSLCLNQTWINYIKRLENVQERESVNEIITEEMNKKLYDVLIEKHQNSIYAKRPNPLGGKLLEGKEKFCSSSLKEQCSILLQILNLTRIGNTITDLTALGASANSGTLRISKEVSRAKEFTLIQQSVTGLYESSVDLLTI